MIKNDFIQLLLQLDTTHREYANTGSEYITVGGFIIRIADHFTVKTSTHDLDVIFLNEDNYIIYPTSAQFKKPQYCTTAEEGIEYIKGWLKWGAPYVKGPNNIAGTEVKFKSVDTVEDTTEEAVSEESIDNLKLDYIYIMRSLGWVESKKNLKKTKWRTLIAAIKSIINDLTKDDEEDLISMLKTCKSASIEKRIEWIKTTFGVSDSDIEEYIVQYTITYDKTRIIQ